MSFALDKGLRIALGLSRWRSIEEAVGEQRRELRREVGARGRQCEPLPELVG